MLQTDDGHWSGDYGGPMFLMPGLICAWYIMGRPKQMLSPHEVDAMIHYLTVHQQSDGGWGTHIESPSTMFGTVLIYVALRLLGMTAHDAVCVRGRAFIRDNHGALYTSSWAKFYLCLLGCMEWEGHNSVPPELWLLPNWCPFHPGRMWCHARMVYLPMGYLYGIRYVYPNAATDETILSLRRELYLESSYNAIDWNKTRHYIAPMDNYSPIPWNMKVGPFFNPSRIGFVASV
jgi:squalene cyclase